MVVYHEMATRNMAREQSYLERQGNQKNAGKLGSVRTADGKMMDAGRRQKEAHIMLIFPCKGRKVMCDHPDEKDGGSLAGIFTCAIWETVPGAGFRYTGLGIVLEAELRTGDQPPNAPSYL